MSWIKNGDAVKTAPGINYTLFLMLLLHGSLIETAKHHIEIPVKEVNCYNNYKDNIICDHFKELCLNNKCVSTTKVLTTTINQKNEEDCYTIEKQTTLAYNDGKNLNSLNNGEELVITKNLNNTDKNILVQQKNHSKETKVPNVHYTTDLEIYFHISIFLMLFIIVFMFNIYFCSSIAYSVYKKRFVPLDR